MKTNLLLLLILGGTSISYSQITFQKLYYSKYGQGAFALCQTSDQGFLLCGEGDDSTTIAPDISVVKTNASGEIQWERYFGTLTGDERAYGCVQTTDGGFVVSTGFYPGNMLLLKTDNQGNLLWIKTFDDTTYSSGFSVEKTSDGGVVVAGHLSYGNSTDCSVIKVDAMGNVVWKKSYHYSGWDVARSISSTNDSGFIMALDLYAAVGFCLVKIDSQGNFEWAKNFNKPLSSMTSYSARQAPDGGYVITGIYNESDYYSTADACLVKTDASGNMQWGKVYGISNNLYNVSVDVAEDGGFVMSGDTYLGGAENYQSYLSKTDNSGHLEWAKKYGNSNSDNGYGAIATTDGGFAMTGYSSGTGYYDVAMFLFKTDSTGTVGCNVDTLSVTEGDSVIIESDVTFSVLDWNTNSFNADVYITAHDSSATWCYTQDTSCNADFTLIPDSFQTGLYWGYNLATGNNLKYFWTWGDGTTAEGQYPSHDYVDSGFYNICLIILDTVSLCSDTFCADYNILKTAGMMQIHEINFVNYPVSTSTQSGDAFSWNVYPNPVSSLAMLDFRLNHPSSVSI